MFEDRRKGCRRKHNIEHGQPLTGTRRKQDRRQKHGIFTEGIKPWWLKVNYVDGEDSEDTRARALLDQRENMLKQG